MEEYESYYDGKIRRVGNSNIVTIPVETVEKLKLKEHEIIEVAIRRFKRND